jgi:hypothetical protein
MPLDTLRLAQLRPYLYHLTAEQNLGSIKRHLELRCARLLLESANLMHLASKRRTEHLPIRMGKESLLIRDQKPLAVGAIAFEVGWAMERFTEHINEHVFFWPGDSTGPIQAGLNHYERYKHERVALVRVSTVDFAPAHAAYSRVNSGAPRCSGGKHSPRGGNTYLPAHLFSGTPSQVIEVVAVHSYPLPPTSEVAYVPHGPWRPLRSAA